MSQTIDGVYRDFKTAGVPTSGEHEPPKPEIRALLKQIQNSSGMSVTRNTKAALENITPPNENYMGVVLTGEGAGYYSRVGGAWVFGRGFSDTLARLEVVGGTPNAIIAEAATGVAPGDVGAFIIDITEANTAAVTISINGGPYISVLSVDGDDYEPGEFVGRLMLENLDTELFALTADPGVIAALVEEATSVAPGTWQLLRDETIAARDDALIQVADQVAVATNKANEAAGSAATAQAAISAPFKGYATEVALLADLVPGAGMVAYAIDTSKFFVKQGASGTGTWSAGTTLAFDGPNILLDPFNEMVFEDRSFGGWAWFPSVPTFATTPNIPLPTPVLAAAGSSTIDRYWEFAALGLRPGQTVTVSALVWFGAINGGVNVSFRDAANAIVGAAVQVNVAAAGLAVPQATLTVPSGADKLLIRASSGSGGGVEVGAYAAAVGQRPGFSRPLFSKRYQEAAQIVPNILVDPFNELVGSRDLGSGTVAGSAYFGTVRRPSPNSPNGKGGIYTAGGVGSQAIRRWAYAPLGLAAGDIITVGVKAFSTSTDTIAQIHFRDAGGASLGNFTSGSLSLSTGLVTRYFQGQVPAGAIVYIDVIIGSASGAERELLASAIAHGRGRPAFDHAPLPLTMLPEQKYLPNVCPDPFNRQYAAGRRYISGFSKITHPTPAGAGVVTLAASPFRDKQAILLPSGTTEAQSRYRVPAKMLGLKVGQTICVVVGLYGNQTLAPSVGMWSASASIGARVNASSVVLANSYGEARMMLPVTQAMVDGAAYLDVRPLGTGATAGAAGVHVCGVGIYICGDVNDQPTLIDDAWDRDQDDIESYFTDLFGACFLRSLRQKIGALIAADATTQLIIGLGGDSWTNIAARWPEALTKWLVSEFGDAGGGYVGFATSASGGTVVGGNARPSVYGFADASRTGTWTDANKTSVAPDLCHAISSTAGSKLTVTGPAAPTLSAAKLFWIGSADGVMRYRWNGGAWTNINVQGGSGSLQTGDLAGFPGAGAWTLELEVVSGTCNPAGIDLRSSAKGVRVHKVAPLGATAQEWASVDAVQWSLGIAALALDLFIFNIGTNDQNGGRRPDQFTDDNLTVINRLRAINPRMDVLLQTPPENHRTTNTVAMAAYSSAVRDLAMSKRVAHSDMQMSFGDLPAEYVALYEDQTHLAAATGGRLHLEIIRRALLA